MLKRTKSQTTFLISMDLEFRYAIFYTGKQDLYQKYQKKETVSQITYSNIFSEILTSKSVIKINW